MFKSKQSLISLAVLIAGCGGSGAGVEDLQAQTLVCEPTTATYRTQGTRSLSTTAWGWQQVTEPRRRGSLSQRFEVRPGDCAVDPGWSDCANDRERSEITVRENIRPSSRVSVAWSLYLANQFEDSPKVKTTLGQLHQRAWFKNGPLLQFELWNGQYQMCIHRLSGDINNPQDRCEYFPLATLTDMRGQWTDVQFEADLSSRTGWVKVWVNGQLKVNSQQPAVVWDPTNFYFKYGVYRSFVSRHGAPMPTQIAYFDEVRQAPRAGLIAAQCNTNPVD